MASRTRQLCTALAWLALVALPACDGDARSDGGGPRGDAGIGDGSLPFDVRPAPDVLWPQADAGPGCGDLGAGGQCEDGGQLRWCDEGVLSSADCAGLALGCGLHPGLDDGAWCLAGVGQSCATWPCRPGLRCAPGLSCEPLDAGAGED